MGRFSHAIINHKIPLMLTMLLGVAQLLMNTIVTITEIGKSISECMKGSCWVNNVSHNMKYSAVYCDTALKLTILFS